MDDKSDIDGDLPSESSDPEDSRFDLVERLDTEDLQALRCHFFPRGGADKLKEKRSEYALGFKYCGVPLTKDEFVKALERILGSSAYGEAAVRLFGALDAEKCGAVWWEQLLDHMIERIGRRDREPASCRPLDPRVDVHHADHCKREAIVKVVPIPSPSTFCYAVLSKYGRVGVYDGRLRLRESYMLFAGTGDSGNSASLAGFGGPGPTPPTAASQSGVPEGTAGRKRTGRAWVTDALYLTDARVLLVLTSDRCLHVLDASALLHAPLCHVSGLRNVPLCAAYAPAPTRAHQSLLLLGDDRGGVAALRFQQPSVSLFRKRQPDRVDRYYWVELDDQPEWVTVEMEIGVHQDAVRQVAYCADNDTVVSCSADPHATIVVRHLAARRTPYVFRLARGVRCFHLERTLKLLATGSGDGVVRLWNPVVTKQPAASLFGHKAAVVDVQVVRRLNAVLSVSNDGVVKVWDVEDQCCLQSLSLGITLTISKNIEFGTRALYPGPPHTDKLNFSVLYDSASVEWPGQDTSARGGRGSRTLRVLVAYCSQLAVLRLAVPAGGARESSAGRGESGGGGGEGESTRAGRSSPGGRRSRMRTPSPPPPPMRERPPRVPSPWRVAETSARLTPDGASAFSDHDSSSPPLSPKREGALSAASAGGGGPAPGPHPRPPPSMGVAAATKTAAAAAGRAGIPLDLHARRAAHARRTRDMRWLVERCAPHLALELHDLEEVRFSQPLPPTARMRERDVETPTAVALTRPLGGGGEGLFGRVGGSGAAGSASPAGSLSAGGGSSSRSSARSPRLAAATAAAVAASASANRRTSARK